MMIGQETQRVSNLVKYELFPEFGHCREVITYNGTAKTFAVGDLVTSTGGVPAAAANIYGVVLANVTAKASTDTKVLVMVRGSAGLSKAAINVGALAIADVKDALVAKDIKVLEAV